MLCVATCFANVHVLSTVRVCIPSHGAASEVACACNDAHNHSPAQPPVAKRGATKAIEEACALPPPHLFAARAAVRCPGLAGARGASRRRGGGGQTERRRAALMASGCGGDPAPRVGVRQGGGHPGGGGGALRPSGRADPRPQGPEPQTDEVTALAAPRTSSDASQLDAPGGGGEPAQLDLRGFRNKSSGDLRDLWHCLRARFLRRGRVKRSRAALGQTDSEPATASSPMSLWETRSLVQLRAQSATCRAAPPTSPIQTLGSAGPPQPRRSLSAVLPNTGAMAGP